MSEQIAFTPPEIDAAWETAHAANAAFDAAREAERRLWLVTQTAGLLLDGLTIERETVLALKVQAYEANVLFASLQDQAANVMRDPNSPFRAARSDVCPGYEVVDRQSPLLGRDELGDFARAIGQPGAQATRAYNALCRAATSVPKHLLQNALLFPDEFAQGSTSLLYVERDADGQGGLLKSVLLNYLKEWLEQSTSHQRGAGGFSAASAKLVGEYFKALDPTLELAVPASLPSVSGDGKSLLSKSELQEMPLEELLLDKITIAGQDHWLVTGASMRAWLKSLESNQVGANYTMVFQSLREKFGPPALTESEYQGVPAVLNETIVYMGAHLPAGHARCVQDYGIPAAEFRRVIRNLEPRDIKGYDQRVMRHFGDFLSILALVERNFEGSKRVA